MNLYLSFSVCVSVCVCVCVYNRQTTPNRFLRYLKRLLLSRTYSNVCWDNKEELIEEDMVDVEAIVTGTVPECPLILVHGNGKPRINC
jgi:hypothetical protein